MKSADCTDSEDAARSVRQHLGVDHLVWLDPMTMLVKLKHLIPGFEYSLVDTLELHPALARWEFDRKRILITRETFAAANGQRSDGRARWSVFHEIVHAVRGDRGHLNRLPSRSEIPRYARKLLAVETSTDQITAAVMAPQRFINETDTAADVAFRFGMSLAAARIRLEEVRCREPRERTVPESVRQLLLELSRPLLRDPSKRG